MQLCHFSCSFLIILLLGVLNIFMEGFIQCFSTKLICLL